jgi:uncharacterized protein (TIGR02147 family)
MDARGKLPVVFDYHDYRAYLRDLYTEKKKRGRGFSFRAFSRRAKLRSPNYLKLVMDGQRNLTREMAGRFAEACGLEGDASAFFVDLVELGQSKTSREREAAYGRLSGFSRYRKAHRLELAQAAYHSTWYLPAIRELAARRDFRDDPEWIARMLRPRIATEEARKALSTLVDLGLLVRGKGSRLAQGAPVVTTGPETRGIHIATYHRAMLQRASSSIDDIPAPERDISSLTLCMSADGVKRLKERVQRFRKELLALSEDEADPKVVVQLGFQLFPLTRAEVKSR